jgi:predicted transposase/invertase (TIGR01784 family)
LELSADEKTRMLYEVREKARRDEAAKIKTAHRKGIAEGIAEGITKGIAEGITKGEAKERIGIAKNLLGMNLAPADIAKATGLPLEEIKKLRQ